MFEEALQIDEERREVTGKGKRERYIQLNTECQRTTRKDKKTFLNKQCKEIEENNRMRKTRDLFKKIGDTKGKIHAKMGTIKDRNLYFCPFFKVKLFCLLRFCYFFLMIQP